MEEEWLWVGHAALTGFVLGNRLACHPAQKVVQTERKTKECKTREREREREIKREREWDCNHVVCRITKHFNPSGNQLKISYTFWIVSITCISMRVLSTGRTTSSQNKEQGRKMVDVRSASISSYAVGLWSFTGLCSRWYVWVKVLKFNFATPAIVKLYMSVCVGVCICVVVSFWGCVRTTIIEPWHGQQHPY